MKKIIFQSLFLLFSVFAASAQDSPYTKAMKKEIAQLSTADSASTLQRSVNAFARIAAVNQREWLPLYYGALAYTYLGLDRSLSAEKRDEALGKAEELTAAADRNSPANAEIVALQGFVTMGKLNVDPSSRGQSLSAQVLQTYGKALSLDNKNPRALVLMAQMELGMAQFFGSGTDKACGLARQSLAIFESQQPDAQKEMITPTWGKSMAERVVKGCK